ncbi:MAG TPA: DedA family protein [Chloroflexota bacterium]|nr:DedA family protein [Chloroflexota bacterium]
MDPSELIDFGDLSELGDAVPDLVELLPVEVLPVAPVPVQHAVGWVLRLLVVMSHHAALLAFLGAFIENTVVLGFLLPGGTVVALSGAAGRTANASLPLLVICAALGMTLGAVTNYYCGRFGVHQVLNRRWTGRIGRELAHQLQNAEPLLRKHGWWVMLFAHAFGPGRSSLALAAGASGFSLTRFLIIELPAAFLWSALYAGGGFLLASEWQNLELMLRRIGWAGAILLVIGAVAWWFSRRLVHRRAAEAAAAAAVAVQPAVPLTYSGSASWSEGAPADAVAAGSSANGKLAPDPATSAASPPSSGAGLRRSDKP